MKRSKSCYGLLLVLVTIFGLSLNVSSGVNALKHEYNGIPVLLPWACITHDSSTGLNSLEFDYSECQTDTSLGSSFSMSFEGDSYDSSYDSLSLNSSASLLRFHEDGSYSQLGPLWYYGPSLVGDSYSTLGLLSSSSDRTYYISSMVNLPSYARRRSPFGSDGFINFDSSTLPSALVDCSPFASNNYSSTPGGNGAVCGGLWNASEYINSQVLPYFYSYDGFYLHSKAIDADGVRYSNTFSFSDLVNSYIPTFSYLDLPLFDYGGYFWDSSNLTSGRSFEFKGYFEFDGSFEWHDNISSNGSYFRLSYDGLSKYSRSSGFVTGYVDCTTNLITLDGLTRLEYSCPLTLQRDYTFFIPHLQISGNGNYVWKTNDEWRFAEVLLVTDHDETPGNSFNSNLTGGGEIPGDAQNDISDDNADWFASLTGLFTFDFFNPFAPIFNLFNNDSCAQIPTLAGMLHSQETQVCPWFDSSIRNITTPVLGLSSMMLVFGFVVRWLGSRSGNFIEDSGGVDSGGYHFENKYRRKK